MTLIAVVGATAAGKSDLAVDLALALGGEVVNADSMQLYQGMDIGTAKLTMAQRRGVPHHLLDVLEVTRPRASPSTRTWRTRSSPTSPRAARSRSSSAAQASTSGPRSATLSSPAPTR